MDIVGCSLFGSRYLRSALNVQFHAPPPSELSSHALCVSSRSSPFAVSHDQHHRHHPHHHHHHHSICDSDFSTSICHVSLTFASKRVKQRNVGASPCFGWTEFFPSFCQSGDLLAHDVHIDKPKACCQQKRARSHVGFRTEWSPASPVTQLPFVSPLLMWWWWWWQWWWQWWWWWFMMMMMAMMMMMMMKNLKRVSCLLLAVWTQHGKQHPTAQLVVVLFSPT